MSSGAAAVRPKTIHRSHFALFLMVSTTLLLFLLCEVQQQVQALVMKGAVRGVRCGNATGVDLFGSTAVSGEVWTSPLSVIDFSDGTAAKATLRLNATCCDSSRLLEVSRCRLLNLLPFPNDDGRLNVRSISLNVLASIENFSTRSSYFSGIRLEGGDLLVEAQLRDSNETRLDGTRRTVTLTQGFNKSSDKRVLLADLRAGFRTSISRSGFGPSICFNQVEDVTLDVEWDFELHALSVSPQQLTPYNFTVLNISVANLTDAMGDVLCCFRATGECPNAQALYVNATILDETTISCPLSLGFDRTMYADVSIDGGLSFTDDWLRVSTVLSSSSGSSVSSSTTTVSSSSSASSVSSSTTTVSSSSASSSSSSSVSTVSSSSSSALSGFSSISSGASSTTTVSGSSLSSIVASSTTGIISSISGAAETSSSSSSSPNSSSLSSSSSSASSSTADASAGQDSQVSSETDSYTLVIIVVVAVVLLVILGIAAVVGILVFRQGKEAEAIHMGSVEGSVSVSSSAEERDVGQYHNLPEPEKDIGKYHNLPEPEKDIGQYHNLPSVTSETVNDV